LDSLASVARPEDTPAEPVHLAGPAEFLARSVLPGIAPLVEKGVRLRVTPGLTEPLLEDLRAGRHDLVIATFRPRCTASRSSPTPRTCPSCAGTGGTCSGGAWCGSPR
jgi:hypothetical protein